MPLPLLILAAVAFQDGPTPPSVPSAPSKRAEAAIDLLERRCLECHGTHRRRPKGRLAMDRRASLLRGGESGTALVPGDVESSLILRAVRWQDELEMPPDEKLAAPERELLEAWVRDGAPWPEGRVARYAEAPPELDRETTLFFENEVRPLLAENCFECHGPSVAEPQSGFRMNGRAGFLRGGASGPALVPGDPEASRMIDAVRYDGVLRMPPRRKLSREQVDVLVRWIELGAPWPGDDGSGGDFEEPELDLEAARGHWSFQPLERPPVPDVPGAEHPIDAFVAARLDEAGLEASRRASPRELLRRASFALTGLPPSYDEVEAFAAAPSDEAFAHHVDALLARPEYGERWARHWLDLVRYSQTNGFERDTEKPYAWRYRDWVVDALNADMPYDRFLALQLAGDELEPESPGARIATGFYRLGAWDDEPNDPVQAEFDELDDVLRTITEGMLGITLGCARCHDHKFDPFTQEDYYTTLAHLRNVARYEVPRHDVGSTTLLPLGATPERIDAWRADWKARMRELRDENQALQKTAGARWTRARVDELPDAARAALRKPDAERTDAERELVAGVRLIPNQKEARAAMTPEERMRSRDLFMELDELKTGFAGDLDWALVVSEVAPEPLPTHVLVRGRAATPGAEVEARFPAIFERRGDAQRTDDGPPPPPANPNTTGRRSALAAWIASPDHPLTARVIANRVWKHHFGRGLAATPDDLGTTGAAPTHPLLLDWLASELVENGWSLKHLHRTILASEAWKRSSHAPNEAAEAADPANRLLWRQEPRRLEAEALRDAMLVSAGALDPARGGRGFFPHLSREALAGASKPGEGWDSSPWTERSRRALYAFSKRGLPVPFLAVFDAPDASLPIGARPSTTQATQALTLLNSDFASECATLLAARAIDGGDTVEARIERLFEHALARRPTDEERSVLASHVSRRTAVLESRTDDAPLIVRPRVPVRLEADFLERVTEDGRGEALLFGPRNGWRALRGVWYGAYNDTYEWHPRRGPALVHTAAPAATDAAVTGTLRLAPGLRTAAIALRARESSSGRGLACVELCLLPEEGRIELAEVDEAGDARVIAAGVLALDAEAPIDFELRVEGSSAAATVAGTSIGGALEATPAEGRLALRVCGEALELDRLELVQGGERRRLEPDARGSAEERAMRSAALLVLNLVEFLHVD